MEKTVSAVISWDKRKREYRLEKDKYVFCSQGLLQTCFRGFRNDIFLTTIFTARLFFKAQMVNKHGPTLNSRQDT